MALMELAIRGAADKYLRGLRTLWGSKQHQDGHTNSSHEIVEQVGQRPEIHAGSSQTKCFEWTVSRSGDMVGDFFMRFTSSQVYKVDDESLMSDAIESVEYKIGGQVIERYSGAALGMLATFDPRARPSFQRESGRQGGGDGQAMEVVMPLRLCTSTGSTHNYLPMIRLRYHEVKVQVHFSRFVEDPRLFASCVLLDTDESRALCHTPEVDLCIFQKMSLSRVVTIDKGNGGPPHPTLIDLSSVDCQVRDLIVTIRGSNGQRSAREPLLVMRLFIGEGKHQRQMSMDGLMARRVIPRQYYGINIDHSPPPIYYMPFDHTPLLDDDCTGSLDFGRVESVKLELKLVPGDTYKIDIMFRSLKILRTQSGMGGLRLSGFIPNINMDGDGLWNAAAPAPVQSPPPTPVQQALVQQAPGMDMKVIMLNVGSAVIAEIRSSLVDARIIYRTSEGAYICDTRPALHAAPHGVLHQLHRIVNGGRRPLARVIGTHVSVGTTDDGMHEHRDESYQVEVENSVRAHEEFEGGGKRGGDDEVFTLLVYLTDVEEGGETVFVSDDNLVEMRVKPQANKAVMFPSRTLHRVLPVKRGRKIVIVAEVKLTSF
eukprot:gene9268-16419_t